MTNNTIYIIGAGGHGREVAELLRTTEKTELFFLDDKPELQGRIINGIEVLGGIDFLKKMTATSSVKVTIALGSSKVMRSIVHHCQSYDLEYVNVIHPSASVSPNSILGHGIVLFENTSVHVNAILGNHVCLNVGASVSHDSNIGDFSILSPGARIAGDCVIGKACKLGMGSSIINGIVLGDDVVVGAGAVVIENVSPMSTVVGVPARNI